MSSIKTRNIKASYYPPVVKQHAHPMTSDVPRRTDWKRVGMVILTASLFCFALFWVTVVVLAVTAPPDEPYVQPSVPSGTDTAMAGWRW